MTSLSFFQHHFTANTIELKIICSDVQPTLLKNISSSLIITLHHITQLNVIRLSHTLKDILLQYVISFILLSVVCPEI